MATKPFAEPVRKREVELRTAFWEHVKSIPRGEKILNCIQCGTCTGTCPVSYMMDVTPREIVALFRAGHIEDILHSRTIWICASCYSCLVRCPSDVPITDLMYALKELAMDAKIYPPKSHIHTLPQLFISNIYKYGRNYEIGMAVRYFLKANFKKLIASAGFGLTMMRKGRISMLPQPIKKVAEVRTIIDRANQLKKEDA